MSEASRTNGHWANHDQIGSSGIFEAVHSGLTVQLIATPREHFMTCKGDDAASRVISRNTDRYDFIPVLEAGPGDEQIAGLFPAERFFAGPVPEGSVRDHMLPIAEDFLIGAHASILDFVTDADRKPCRLVLSGVRISGLVSISDLQKLPVRAALFALITGFEIILAEAIRELHPKPDSWMRHLSSGRRGTLHTEIERSKKDDGFVDTLLFTQFCDKADIVRKSLNLSGSKTKLEGRFIEIQRLRDSLAHANEYAASPEQAQRVCAVVRSLLALRLEIMDTVRVGDHRSVDTHRKEVA